jgi:hypothetical protein
MDSYTIRIKTLVPATHEVSVVPTTTAAALNSVVATITGVPAHRQRLIWRGRVMEDAQTLEQLGARRRAPGARRSRARGAGGGAPCRPRAPPLRAPRMQSARPLTRRARRLPPRRHRP